MNRLAGAVAIGAVLRLPLGEPASFVTVRQADEHRVSVDWPSAALSSDGRYVAFTSTLPLAPDDTNRQRDVYVLDRADGRVTLESGDRREANVRGDSDEPVISADGRWVAFRSINTIVVRDRVEGRTVTIGDGRTPAISADGRFVAFASTETNLVPGEDANGIVEDIYLAEISSGQIRRVSVDTQGHQLPTGSSSAPSISGDGMRIVFSSMATLAPRSAKGLPHVYVRDLGSQTTRLIGTGWRPSISANGRFVAFASSSATMASDDRNNLPDVFVADLQTSRIELISRNAGGSGAGSSVNPALSGDGRFVAFQSDAADLTCASRCPRALEDINLLWDVFVFDRMTGAMWRISSDPGASWMEESSAPAIDASGTTVVFSSRHPIDGADKANDFDLFIFRR
jgi:Tol biopolymer transport system component